MPKKIELAGKRHPDDFVGPIGGVNRTTALHKVAQVGVGVVRPVSSGAEYQRIFIR